jgi:hypothetical protein
MTILLVPVPAYKALLDILYRAVLVPAPLYTISLVILKRQLLVPVPEYTLLSTKVNKAFAVEAARNT